MDNAVSTKGAALYYLGAIINFIFIAMSKKLLGTRSIGDKDYEAGTIFSDEEAAATGLPASDFVEVKAPAPAPEPKPTPTAKPDADAEIDASAKPEEKNDVEQSSAGTAEKQGDAPVEKTDGEVVSPESATA